jgi:hypothetical protein
MSIKPLNQLFIAGALLVGVSTFVGSGSTNAGSTQSAISTTSAGATAPVAAETLPIANLASSASAESEYHSASGEGQFTAGGQLVGGR